VSRSDVVPFLKAWLRQPLHVASVAPSSRALAGLMTRGIGPRTGPVIELGPGTGAFTRALLERGVAERDLVLVESEPDFAALLRRRFPAARVAEMDAADLARTWVLDPSRPAGAVVSGLPVLSMPRLKVAAILTGAFAQMRPGGAFHQFTYTLACPIPAPLLREMGLESRLVGWTLANMPPARVYRIAHEARPPLSHGERGRG
jgi:phospholipid N-methyltransferase